nr:MAG TPA: hypothetical protein [Caudoviricetes sp.]
MSLSLVELQVFDFVTQSVVFFLYAPKFLLLFLCPVFCLFFFCFYFGYYLQIK